MRARAKGTTARPLDGGALPHGRARAGKWADGGAGHLLRPPVVGSRRSELSERGGMEKKEAQELLAWQWPAVEARDTPALAPPDPARERRERERD